MSEVNVVAPIQSGADHMIVLFGLYFFSPNFIPVIFLLVVVFLGVAAHLGGASGLHEMGDHIPILFVELVGWIEGWVPWRKAACSSGSHLPSL